MVLMVETVAQARQIVEWAKYPPLGRRSYSGGAHTGYGSSGNHAAVMKKANASVPAIAQIETVEGVRNVDEIFSVDGVDAAVVGPCDLAISMGRPDEVGCDEEMLLVDAVCSSCKRHRKGFGLISGSTLIARYAKDTNLMVSAIDAHLLRKVLSAAADEYRKIREYAND